MSQRLYDAGGDPPMTWRNRVRVVRQGRGLSQAELARRAQLPPSSLNIIESHQRQPGIGVLLRLAAVLDCSISDLVEVQAAAPKEQEETES